VTAVSKGRTERRPLHVLQVNKFHFLNGGAELYYLGLSRLLRENGHVVGHFAMKHPENISCDQARYFVDQIDYGAAQGLAAKVRTAVHTVYSAEARRKMASLLDNESYDIVHLHNFHHQITPSILPEIKKRGIPIVFTVHDFKIVCPNYKMLTHDGVCERCKGHRYYNCALHRCTKGSLAASVLNTVEMYFHHFRGYDQLYDRFLASARFTGNKIVEFGIPREKVRYVPNFVHVQRYEPQYEPGSYLLYLGRLSLEKGVPTLVQAMKNLPDVPLKITGRGPYEEEIRRIVSESSLGQIELTGHLRGKALEQTIRGAMAVVIPSEWYENCPLALIEAYAYGKPVIGARIGGLGEMVIDGETGYQFEAGNATELAEVLRKAVSDKERLRAMGVAARGRALDEYDGPRQYERIMSVYGEVLGGNGPRPEAGTLL
jgi:glycosyltransferase involved in cell wall biosynthesis